MLLGNCKQVNKKKAKKPVVGEEQVDTEKQVGTKEQVDIKVQIITKNLVHTKEKIDTEQKNNTKQLDNIVEQCPTKQKLIKFIYMADFFDLSSNKQTQ